MMRIHLENKELLKGLKDWIDSTEIYEDCTVLPNEYYSYLVFWSSKLMEHCLDGSLKQHTTMPRYIIERMADVMYEESTRINNE